MLLKLFNLFGLVIFSLFAYLQLNDASQYGNYDAWIWVALYSMSALFNLWALFESINKSVILVWCGFITGCLLFRVQDDQGNLHFDWIAASAYVDQTNGQMIQNTNEAGGLVVMLIWALLQLWLNRAKRRNSWH
ncbi:transmembrane 220 family protein [Glaciecola sp. 1036]|uniref:transmembrane 220 family protein n=1 Tax=Alteromonadaceae TaxID=72275 RepID=UPI003D0166D1